MFFYEIWVASISYHKQAPLTYSSDKKLSVGDIVEVHLQSKVITGFVARACPQPKFSAKPVIRVIETARLPSELIKLHHWLLEYYPAPSGQITQLFVPTNLPQKITTSISPAASNIKTSHLPPLTKEQTSALKTIRSKRPSNFLLHGDTGTGKTRVYVELTEEALNNNQSAIILTPEIGLTPQLQKTLREVFGERVVVNHSKLTAAERRSLWLRVAATIEPLVIVGPRSALFLPVKNLGLIVLDEAHDHSYKQEQSPNYVASRVGAKLAQLHNVDCIFGTATPLVADFYSFKAHHVPIIRMTERIGDHIKEPSIVVIARGDKEKFKRSWLFSEPLLQAIEEVKQNKKTSLIFLNRRGTARLVICNNCGWQATCPRCDLPLAYHQDQHSLRCHVCGYNSPPKLACPDCQNTDIQFRSAGTKALQEELHKLFPDLSISRFDSDNTTSESLEKAFDTLHRGEVDIIIGTQIIAKGFDLPTLGLVGIPFADSSLYIPDYTADEQTFQLLTQVMGRVGRTDQATKIIVQTYDADQPVLKAALAKKWNDFYNKQLIEREQYQYPPFHYLLQLSYSAKTEVSVKQHANALAEQLKKASSRLTILGPTPRFHHKINDVYNWQIIVKAKNRKDLLAVIKQLPPKWRHNIDPVNLL